MKLDPKDYCAKSSHSLCVSRPGRTQLLLLFVGFFWLSLVSIGLSFLWSYENAPGTAADPPSQWPVESRIQPSADKPTLVMLAHPHCPCTRASIGELAAIIARTQGRLTAYVLFLKPDGVSVDWEKTDLWQSANNIPGVNVILDDDGREARLFHAATSGQTLLYNSEGRLVFKGGITASRGHFGDNAGRSAIVALVNTEVPTRTDTYVFGCPLFDTQSECPIPTDENNRR